MARTTDGKRNGNGKVVRTATDLRKAEAAFEDLAGLGMETVEADDLLIPRLAMVQAISPQLVKSEAAYVADARQGDIVDTATNSVVAQPADFLPVVFRKSWVEWAPRESGRGLVAIHPTAEVLSRTTPNDRGAAVTEEGNTIEATSNFFGFLLGDGEARKVFLPMKRTQVRVARQWLSLASGERLKRADGSSVPAPLFRRVYRLESRQQSNAIGTWHGWKVERGPLLAEWCAERKVPFDEMVAECKAFHESIAAGKHKPVFDGDEMPGDDEVPF